MVRGDYSEIRSTPADPWHAVRAYARGEQAGIARAVVEDWARWNALAAAYDTLALIGVPLDEARDMVDLATLEARVTLPGLDPVAWTTLGALNLVRLVERALKRRVGDGRQRNPWQDTR